MAKEQDDKVVCPVCENRVGTKDEGTVIKAHRISGVKCDGSDEPVPLNDTDTLGIDKGQSYETLEAPQDDEQATDDSTDPATPTEPETGTQSVSASEREFTHVFSIRKPCNHVHHADSAWHAENTKMVDKLARKAGHVPTREPYHTGNEETETHVLVTYSVPVK